MRKFAQRPIEDDKLEYVLQAALTAPSASNRQTASFVVVRDPATIAEIARTRSVSDGRWLNGWLTTVPAIIVACGDRDRAATHHGVEFWQVDTAIATEHLVLAAVDAELGTCWIGAFDETTVRTALGIPASIGILAMLAIGYPADRMSVTERMTRVAVRADSRKPMAEFARWERW